MGALQRYKLRAAYRQNRRLRRQVYNARKFKDYLQANKDTKQGSAWSINTFGADWAQANDAQKSNRKALRYYGPGDYREFLSKWVPQGTFAHLGRQLGGMTGVPGLNAAGAFAGHKLSKFLGFGDYTSNQIAGGDSSQISVNQMDYSGDIYVTRTEFVRNITVSGTAGQPTAFQMNRFELNPGIANTFPWLSQIAQNFTLYDFEGLMFQYKPLFSEDAGSASNLGKVIMATNYDPDAGDFRSSIEMENYDYANSCKPSNGLIHGVETAQHQQSVNLMYVRAGVSTKDKVFTDVGSFQLATEGIPLAAAATSAIIGELWVTYRVKLSRAELYNSLLGYGVLTDVLRGTTSTAALTTGTTFVKSTNSIGVTVFPDSATSFIIFFPVTISLGYYQITVLFESGATVFTTQECQNPDSFTNCQCFQAGRDLPDGTVGGVLSGPGGPPTGTTGNTRLMVSFGAKINSPGLSQASVRIRVSAALSNTTTWYLQVTQANGLVAENLN